MIKPEEAEKLANDTVQDYVNACGCNNEQDVANVLMKLISMSGLATIAVVGQYEAMCRMEGTVDYLARPEHGMAWLKSTVQ